MDEEIGDCCKQEMSVVMAEDESSALGQVKCSPGWDGRTLDVMHKHKREASSAVIASGRNCEDSGNHIRRRGPPAPTTRSPTPHFAKTFGVTRRMSSHQLPFLPFPFSALCVDGRGIPAIRH
jgi:hypothetical protein